MDDTTNEYTRIYIRVKKKKKEDYVRLAKKADRSLNNWIIHVVDEEIKKSDNGGKNE